MRSFLNKIVGYFKKYFFVGLTIILCISIVIVVQHVRRQNILIKDLRVQNQHGKIRQDQLSESFKTMSKELVKNANELYELKNADQYVRNNKLEADIASIEKTYKNSIKTYESLLALSEISKKTESFEASFSAILTLLSKRDYATAEGKLKELDLALEKEKTKVASSFQIPANVAVNNSAPGSGYSRQKVQSDVGDYLVDIIAADLNSTRVIVDTASDGDCRDNCPVDSLASFASRSGAFAGINGPYFCPASYPSCAGKTNSYDTLIMNNNKVYFNSENNVYSTVPAVIFSGNSARYVGQSLEWGRDGGVDSVIAAQPMLLSGGNVTFGGDAEAKRSSSGNRSFIGSKGSTVYIGVVHSANVAQAARVLKTLGLEYALNLDGGASVGLWSGGKYIISQGRSTPFGILFVRK